MLTEVLGGLKIPDFRMLETQGGYEELMSLKLLYETYIKEMTIKRVYMGCPEVPIFREKLQEYLAVTAKRAA